MKAVVVLFALCLTVVAGCGGGSSSSRSDETIDSVGSIVVARWTGGINLTISAVSANITIKAPSDVGELVISGQNNLIHFDEGTAVEYCLVTGSDNTVEYPAGLMKCQVKGPGNTFLPY